MNFATAFDEFFARLSTGETIHNSLAHAGIELPFSMRPEALISHFLSVAINSESYCAGLDLQQIYTRLPRAVCGAVLSGISVRCMTCSNDQNSVYCRDCFDESQHIGHSYVYFDGAGMCDCGFLQTIKREGFCKKHTGNFEQIRQETSNNFDVARMQAWFQYAHACILYFVHIMSSGSDLTDMAARARYSFARDAIATLLTTLIKIFQETPIDMIKFQFTKSLCVPARNMTLQRLLAISSAEEMYMDFVDIRKLIFQLRNNPDFLILDTPPVIVYFILQFLLPPSDKTPEQAFQRYLVFYHVSEPCFRQVMCFNYYMIKPFVCQIAVGKACDVIDSITHSDERSIRPILSRFNISQTFMHEISVQTHNCVALPVARLNLSQSFEFLEDYLALANFAKPVTYWFLVPLEAIIEQGAKELGLQISTNQDCVRHLVSVTDDVKFRNGTAQNITNMQLFNNLTEGIVLGLARNFITSKFSQKNVSFVSELFSSKLSSFAYFNYFSLFSGVFIPRYVQRTPGNDMQFGNALSQYYFTTTIVLMTMQYCVFYTMLFDTKTCASDIMLRITDIMQQNHYQPENIVIARNVAFNCVLQLLRFVSNQRNGFVLKDGRLQFCFERQSYHCFDSQFAEGSEHEVHHLVQEGFSSFLAVILNSYTLYNYNGISNFEPSLTEFIDGIFEYVSSNFAETTAVKCKCDVADLICNVPVRTLVTYQLFCCKGFVRLGESVYVCCQLIYNLQYMKNQYFIYQEYQLLQQLMLYYFERADRGKWVGFFQMIAEQFGIYSFASESFVLGNECEQMDRRVKMLAGFIKVLGILMHSYLAIKSCYEWIQAHLIQQAYQGEYLFMSQIIQAFAGQEFYSPKVLIDLFSQISDREESQKDSQLYTSNIFATKFKLRLAIVQNIDIFNPFFVDEPQTTYRYEQKCGGTILPCLEQEMYFQAQFDELARNKFVWESILEFFSLYASQRASFCFVSQNELLIAAYLMTRMFATTQDEALKNRILRLVQSLQQTELPATLKLFFVARYGKEKNQHSANLSGKMRLLKAKVGGYQQTVLLDSADVSATVNSYASDRVVDERVIAELYLISGAYYQCPVCLGLEKRRIIGVVGMVQPTAMLYRIFNGEKTPDSTQFALLWQSGLLDFTLLPERFSYSTARVTQLSALSRSHYCAGVRLQQAHLCYDFYDPTSSFVSLQFRSCSHLAHCHCHFRAEMLQSIVCPICRRVSPQTFPIIQTAADTPQFLRAVLTCAGQILQSLQQGSPECIEDPLLDCKHLEDILSYLETGALCVSSGAQNIASLRGARDLLESKPLMYYSNQLFFVINMYIDLVFQATLLASMQEQLSSVYYISGSLLFQAQWLFNLLCGKYTSHRLIDADTLLDQYSALFSNFLYKKVEGLLVEQACFRFVVLFKPYSLPQLYQKRVDADFWGILLREVQVSQMMFIDFRKIDLQAVQSSLDAVAQSPKHTALLGDELNDAETFVIARRLAEIRCAMRGLETLALSEKLAHISGQLGELEHFRHVSERRFPEFHLQFPQQSLSLLKERPLCAQHSQKSMLQCLYCGFRMCAVCDKDMIYQHQRVCYVTGAWYIKFRNLVVFPDVPFYTHLAAGPYLDQYQEDDPEFQKRIPMSLSQPLLDNLRRHLQRNATGDLDVGRNVVNFVALMRSLIY